MIELILSMMSPTMVLVFIVTFLLTYYIRQMPSMRNMPPGPFPLPVLGNFLNLQKDPGDDIHNFVTLAKQYGKLCSLKIGMINAVIISDYNLLLEAFVKNADVYTNRPKDILYVMKYLNDQLGPGIVTNDGHSWKQLRRTALMTMRDFGVGKKSLEEKIQEEISILLDTFGQKKGKPFNAKLLFNLATSNIICGVVFGTRFDYEDEKFKELLKHLDRSLAINPFFVPVNFFPFLRHIPHFRKLPKMFGNTLLKTTEYIKELIASNEPTFDPDNIRDFVDLFIKTKREHKTDDSYNERNTCRVIVDMFTAGSDTTANTLAWLILFMAKHQDVQTKCQKEIDEVVGKGKWVSMADKDNLHYVEATILETLRMRPPAPTGVPHCTSKDSQLNGYFIPKDTLVFSNLLFIQNDPEIFPDPNEFRPEHFLDENGKIIHRERMVAFSLGPRSCLGEILARMELILFFASIIQFYTITPEPGKPVNLAIGENGLILRPELQNLVYNRRD